MKVSHIFMTICSISRAVGLDQKVAIFSVKDQII